MYNHPQGALPCLSRSRSERRSSSQTQPANQSRTSHDSSNPLTIIPRHRIPSNRIPTSTKWPQQSKRSTPKSGPTRSRTTSAQPVSRHLRMRRDTTCKRRRVARAHACDLWSLERMDINGWERKRCYENNRLTMASTIQTSGARPPTSVSPLRPSWTPRKTPRCTSSKSTWRRFVAHARCIPEGRTGL